MFLCEVWVVFFGCVIAKSCGFFPPEARSSPLWNTTAVDLLRRDLLQSYDKFARPAQNTHETEVDVSLSIKHIQIDDSKFIMAVNALMRLSWKDERLVWNEKDYGGIVDVKMADHEIWEPDLSLLNSAIGNSVDHFGNVHCIVQNTGQVSWVPPAQFAVFCDLDVTKWPFDTHTCRFHLGSWNYAGDEINFTHFEKPGVSLDKGTPEWESVEVSSQRNVTIYTNGFIGVTVTFFVTAKRNGSAYMGLLFIPSLASILMTLFVFWLPPNSHGRFTVHSLTAVHITLHLLYLAQKVPLIGSNTPLIVVFFSTHLAMVVLSIIVSVCTFNLSTFKKPVPHCVRTFINSPWTAYIGVRSCKQNGYVDEVSGEEEMRGYDESREEHGIVENTRVNWDDGPWTVIAAIINRILFFIYLIIFMFLTYQAIS